MKLKRKALLPPDQSAWMHLYLHGDNQSFLVITGVDRSCFQAILQILFPDVLNFDCPPYSTDVRGRGRPQSLPPSTKLGILLLYLCSMMHHKHLCVIFGVTPSTMSRVLHEMLHLFIKKFKDHPESCIRWPSSSKMQHFARLVSRREPRVRRVIGFMDGLSLDTECNSDPTVQNSFYNSYNSDTCVNNVLIYGPDGKVFQCGLNFPGSWHDSNITYHFFSYIKRKIGDYRICVDQGFPRSGDALDIFVGPMKKKRIEKLSPILKDVMLDLAAAYVSLRQASEWGMRSLQGTFPRLKKRLPTDKHTRLQIIHCSVLLHNFRTTRMGINQIATVFDEEYMRFQNLQNYDRIRNYFIH